MPGAVASGSEPAEDERVELLVVVPVLDEAASLAAHLTALQSLRSKSVRVVVADGGSSDHSREIATGLTDRTVRSGRGRAVQMNAGAALLPARVLLFLHADTRLPDGAVAKILQAVKGGRTWGRFDVRIDSERPVLRLVARLMNLRSRLTGIATGDQAIFVSAAAFRAVGGFPDLPLMEDIEMSRRLKRIAWPACLREQVVTSARRWEEGGAWRTIGLMWCLRAAYFLGADPARLARRYGPARTGKP